MTERVASRRASPLFALIAALSFGAVGVALVTQHAMGMQPCPWCVLQRLVFVAIGGVALGGAAAARLRAAAGTAVAASGVVLLALAGLAAALWQHFVAASSTSCNLTLADRIVSAIGADSALPSVFAAYASCADAKTTLLGVPYEFHSAALFAIVAVTALAALRRRGAR